MKTYEPFEWRNYKVPVIGVDEVGRGCLAGPVFAAAVMLDLDILEYPYTDSKKISEKQRNIWSDEIKNKFIWSVAFATVEEIDELNILNASLLAMNRAVVALNKPGSHVLVDGNQKIKNLEGYEQTTVVKGDLRASPIAAASIVAKVARDEHIKKMDEVYPGYEFSKHKGYATSLHKEVIKAKGPSPIHRLSFKGVKEFVTPAGPAL
ncbi:MAG: ribonuclease HII [Bdellovibrionales bacterium]|nr:ribonuclease HII [Bdellovibrionales bacterium]